MKASDRIDVELERIDRILGRLEAGVGIISPDPNPFPRLSLFRIRAFWGHSRRAAGVAE